jgi:hypothetical protein
MSSVVINMASRSWLRRIANTGRVPSDASCHARWKLVNAAIGERVTVTVERGVLSTDLELIPAEQETQMLQAAGIKTFTIDPDISQEELDQMLCLLETASIGRLRRSLPQGTEFSFIGVAPRYQRAVRLLMTEAQEYGSNMRSGNIGCLGIGSAILGSLFCGMPLALWLGEQWTEMTQSRNDTGLLMGVLLVSGFAGGAVAGFLVFSLLYGLSRVPGTVCRTLNEIFRSSANLQAELDAKEHRAAQPPVLSESVPKSSEANDHEDDSGSTPSHIAGIPGRF